MGFFDRIREGLSKTKQQIVDRFDEIVSQSEAPSRKGRPIDVDTIDALEELLIMADVGVSATERIIAAVKEQTATGKGLRDAVKDEIRAIFASVSAPAAANGHVPHVVLIVGVNGTGKTTTVGKLAQLLKSSGKNPLVVAADTYRAAAVEQLQIWAARAGVDLIRAREGADPAAVVFDGIASSKAKGRDPVLVDTAGRLHTKVNLMNELEKIRRVAAREVSGAPHEVLLVLDATVGQNALSQATEFTRIAGVTGLVMTKLDGTARGGILVALAAKHKLPVHFIGVGEGVDDLSPFAAKDFANAIAGIES
jgi:fused signal recognition particle receptor